MIEFNGFHKGMTDLTAYLVTQGYYQTVPRSGRESGKRYPTSGNDPRISKMPSGIISSVFTGCACPFVYTYDEKSGGFSFDTVLLYGLDSKVLEGEDRKRLERFNGELILREVEPETSYMDSLCVELTREDGTKVYLEPDNSLLKEVDGKYLILKTGDEAKVRFPEYSNTLEYNEAFVNATGYYVPEN